MLYQFGNTVLIVQSLGQGASAWNFSATGRIIHTDPLFILASDRIMVHFRDSKGELIKSVEGNEGDSLLDLAQEYDVDLEGSCCFPLLRLMKGEANGNCRCLRREYSM